MYLTQASSNSVRMDRNRNYDCNSTKVGLDLHGTSKMTGRLMDTVNYVQMLKLLCTTSVWTAC